MLSTTSLTDDDDDVDELRAPLQHRRMNENERRANKMQTQPHSTAPDWRLTENAGPIAAQGAVAATRPAWPISARRYLRPEIARQSRAPAPRDIKFECLIDIF